GGARCPRGLLKSKPPTEKKVSNRLQILTLYTFALPSNAKCSLGKITTIPEKKLTYGPDSVVSVFHPLIGKRSRVVTETCGERSLNGTFSLPQLYGTLN